MTDVMRYFRRDGIDTAPMDDQTVLYDPTANKFCVLNEAAAAVWQRLESGGTVDQLVEAVLDLFHDVDAETARTDVDEVLTELTELDLITRST